MMRAIVENAPSVLTVLSILAIVTGAARYITAAVVKSVAAGRDQAITQFQERQAELADEERLERFEATLNELSGALQSHMIDEEEISNRIERMVAHLGNSQGYAAVQVIKSQATLDPIMTLVHRVWPGGYELVWANQAYLNTIGLDLEEAKAGNWWLSIHKAERDIIRSGAEDTGQEQTDYHGEYTMVHARTQEVIGTAEAYGYPIEVGPDEWYYVSQIRIRENEIIEPKDVADAVKQLSVETSQSAYAMTMAVTSASMTPTMLYEIDTSKKDKPWQVKWVNQAYLSLTGWTLKEVLDGGDVASTGGEQREIVLDRVTASAVQQAPMVVEYTLLDRDGNVVCPVRATANPLHSFGHDKWFYVAQLKCLDD